MAFLLCGFGAFMVVQAIKAVLLPTLLPFQIKLFLALLASFGAAGVLFPHHPSELVIYGTAGAGLAVLIHRIARLIAVAGDWVVGEIMRKNRR